MADDESRGVHLSDKQLVFVFMAATVAAVVVFLFGVLVGRGVHGARGPVGGSEMTAAEGQVVPDGAPDEGAAAEHVGRQGSGGSGPEDLSYPERLGKTPPDGTAQAGAAAGGGDAAGHGAAGRARRAGRRESGCRRSGPGLRGRAPAGQLHRAGRGGVPPRRSRRHREQPEGEGLRRVRRRARAR